MTSPPVLVVTGLAREERIAAETGVVVLGAGGNPARLRAFLEAHRAADYRTVISFGIAGGLDATLLPGAVILGSGVVSGDTRWPGDPAIMRRWARLFEHGGVPVVVAEVAGAESPLLNPMDKSALRAATGAAAVDMESHVAAAFAAGRGLPFAALRVVCDPAGRALPPLAAKALRPDGRLDLTAILGSLARQPAQLAALPRLARDASAAFAALGRVRAALGPGFGLGGLGLGETLGDVL